MKDLVQIIRDNPGCVAYVDNDCWTLYRKHPDSNPHADDDPLWNRWNVENELANEGDVAPATNCYGSGNCYGGDILQALAAIVGITVESV